MLMRALISLAALAACGQASTQTPATPQLEQAWRLGGLAAPESVALSNDGAFLYVSNVNGEGEARDGNGFISRVSTSGELLQRDFATGLNGPKGMMQGGDALYVADIDRLVVLDAQTGAVRRTVPIAGAEFLNDLTFAPSGEVLLADSGTARIFAVDSSNTVTTWAEGELLSAANGFLNEPSRLLVTTMQGRVLAIDYATRAITVLAEGLGDADGIAPLGGDRYLVTAWPGEMFVVDAASGAHERIMDTRQEPRYLNDILLVGDMLYVPHWEPGELTAYRVAPLARP
jgi:DNA-binding beta-propeller fold protein YncE